MVKTLRFQCREHEFTWGSKIPMSHGMAKKPPKSSILLAVKKKEVVQFSRSVVSDSVTPWTAACQASLSITNSRSLLKLMSIRSVMPSNHLILCHPLLLLPLIFPSIRVFSYESILHISWPRYWSFSISPFNEYSGLIADKMGTNRRES